MVQSSKDRATIWRRLVVIQCRPSVMVLCKFRSSDGASSTKEYCRLNDMQRDLGTFDFVVSGFFLTVESVADADLPQNTGFPRDAYCPSQLAYFARQQPLRHVPRLRKVAPRPISVPELHDTCHSTAGGSQQKHSQEAKADLPLLQTLSTAVAGGICI